mmetsp:Transcript_8479/g.15369  ORF Transcript_8479/g.15369 Transcript_8479/m.15369 type:complete len:325 (-) Transcript_8479:123-1097(-)
MHSSLVCSGIFLTAGRAVFVWIDEPVKKKNARRAKKQKALKKIYVTEELEIDHPNYLRVMASFLVKSFAIPDGERRRAASLLGVASSSGGFTRGPTQKHTPKGKYRGDKKPAANSDNTNTTNVAATALSVAMTLPQLSQVPDFKEGSIIAATLGRERQGRVIGTEWHGISAAVKIVCIDGNDGHYAHEVFRSEVEAYRLAGAAGLWGKAVPGPLFVAETDKVCALGMVAGVPMPLEPQEWTGNDLQQAKESVFLLHQSKITLSDIKPANFVKLSGSGMNGNILETVTRVVAIDLECFLKNASDVELPPWLLREGSPSLISCERS